MLNVPSPSSCTLLLELHPALSSLPRSLISPAVLLDRLACFDRTLFQKQPVDLFQSEITRLRIAEVYKWDERKVEGHENEVPFPRQVVQKGWSNHDNEEVPQPVRGDANRCPLGTNVEGQDLRHIYPRNTVGSGTKNEHVREKEGHAGSGCRLCQLTAPALEAEED